MSKIEPSKIVSSKMEPSKIEIVAELAQGFEGRPELASLLLKAAAAAGADAAKFRLVYADELATPDYKYYDLFRSLEMPDEVWSGLAISARDQGIGLYLDVFGERSLALAARIGAGTVKLHGTDIANLGFLARLADSPVRRVMLGAGGARAAEIDTAITLLEGKEVVIQLGFQAYPTPTPTNQIARVSMLRDRYRDRPDVTLGFADHAPPEDETRFALAAVALGAGARVFEKHLTLGRIMKLEDHESALNPDEFLQFSRVIRDCEAAHGVARSEDDFGMSEAEEGYRTMIRRHVVANAGLAAGKTLEPSDLVLKRSSGTQLLTDLEAVYGKVLVRPLQANEPVTESAITAATGASNGESP